MSASSGPNVNLGNAAKMAASTTNAEGKTYTVRELIKVLADASDLDAEVSISLFNSDPIPVTSADENEEQFVLSTAS